MIRLELRPDLRIKLAPEIEFYEQNDELLTASFIAGAVLGDCTDFGENSAEARRGAYNEYMDAASKMVLTPAQFLDYDGACAHVGALVQKVLSRGKMSRGVLTMDSLSYKAHHAEIMGYCPFRREKATRAPPQLLAGFSIKDDFIPSQLAPHLATLSFSDGSPLRDLETVFGVQIKSPRPIKKGNIAFCAYGLGDAKALLEDITYQRDSA